MSKITTEVRYKDMSFNLVRETRGMQMYFSTDSDYCIIVDKEGEVLFEVRAEYSQASGYLEDGLT